MDKDIYEDKTKEGNNGGEDQSKNLKMEKSIIHNENNGLPIMVQPGNDTEKHNVLNTKNNDSNMQKHTGNDISSYNKTQKGLLEVISVIGYNYNNTSGESIISIKEEDTCVFCLEPKNLIHFCECTVMAHKTCAVKYVTYPSNVNDTCPVCRRFLPFEVIYGDTSMKTKFIFYIILIILANLGCVAVSLYITTLVIPQNGMGIYLYILIIANVGFIAPLLLVFLIAMALEVCAPRAESRSSGSWDCYLGGGGCEGCSGDGCEIVLLGIFLILIVLFLISAIAFMTYNIWRYHKCFRMKSAVDIQFQVGRKVI